MAWWVTLEDGREGCVEVKWVKGMSNADLVKSVKTVTENAMGSKVVGVQGLPYPANPRWVKASDCPSFCYTPKQCAGRSSCPKSYACSE